MSYTYTTLAADSFHRANENPVNPAVWSAGLSGLGVHTPCQLVSNELEPTAAASAAFYSGVSWPANQWAEVQVDACQFSDDNDYASVLLVLDGTSATDTYYAFEVDGALGASCNVAIFGQSGSLGLGEPVYLGTEDTDAVISLFAGDMIRMELFNNFLSAYVIHNGVSTQVLAPVQGIAGMPQSGEAGIVLYEDTQPSDAQVSNFSGGLIAASQSVYSVTDSRDYGDFPNDAVDVQGTEMYTVPARPSRTPPVDSRVDKPADSRKFRPENSRTFPPFSK